jgi:hypothetical protein
LAEGRFAGRACVNACFNCCPGEIEAEFAISGDSIRVQEAETEGMCACLCLFDLQHSIRNLEPGEYAVAVSEPYVSAEEKQLAASMTLNDGASGAFCVERAKYPWGTP